MIWLCFCWLTVAGPEISAAERYPEAEEVFHCNFDATSDTDFNDWPDGWTRQRGPGYPAYQKIQIQPIASAASEKGTRAGMRCLRIEVSGGGAAVFSPPISIERSFSYLLEGLLQTHGLKYDRAYLSLRFFDAAKQPLKEFSSEEFTNTEGESPLSGKQKSAPSPTGWQKIRLGPVTALSPEARWVVIGLHVEPGREADLQGFVDFADLWLARVPRLELKTNHPQNLFPLPAQPEITCTASGMNENVSEVTFELFDVFGNNLGREKLQMSKVEGRESKVEELSATNAPRLSTSDLPPVPLAFSAVWRPPVPGPGFYRVRAALKGRNAIVRREELTLAVFSPQSPPAGGEFGWSLPDGGRPLALPALTALLTQAGIHWVKYPLWCTEENADRLWEETTDLIGRLEEQGMELIGLLVTPPEPLQARFAADRGWSPSSARDAGRIGENGTVPGEHLSAAEIFAGKTSLWYPSLEPLLARIASRVPYWQLGGDTDTSLLSIPNFSDKLAEIQRQFHQTAPEIGLAIGWDWMRALPEVGGSGQGAEVRGQGSEVRGQGSGVRGQGAEISLPLSAVSLSAQPPLSVAELAAYLEASQKASLLRWPVIVPLPKDAFPLPTRARDLFERMLTAKIHGADAAFCPDPFAAQCGLMNPDGTPGELFLAWRTTALEIGGKEYLGRLVLPGGSPNAVFVCDGRVVLIVWNDLPRDEILPFSEELEAVDLWGRRHPLEKTPEGHRLQADRLPVFVRGLSESVTRWCLDLKVEKKRLPLLFGQPQSNRLIVPNPFPGGVVGTARLFVPEGWKVEPNSLPIRLAAGETWQAAFDLTLPFSADTGPQELRIDVDLQTDPPRKFSIFRPVDVASGGVSIEVNTRLNEQNQLEVEQRFINHTPEEVNFRCGLYAPDRRQLSTQIIGLGRGADTKVYRLDDGRNLLGKTLWLHAEEYEGPRILNYHFPAKP